MTIEEILADRAAANHPATAARKAADAALDRFRSNREKTGGAVKPPVSLLTSPPADPLPPPVELLTEAAALARLFPATAAATPGEAEPPARAEWLRSTLPAAVAVDQGGAVFYPVAAVAVLIPHAAAIMAAEREEAENARALAFGRAYLSARAAGASHAEAAKLLAGMAG